MCAKCHLVYIIINDYQSPKKSKVKAKDFLSLQIICIELTHKASTRKKDIVNRCSVIT